ncbi:hypothetical protein MHYP_G00274820 [Metynnis hypsauchen]
MNELKAYSRDPFLTSSIKQVIAPELKSLRDLVNQQGAIVVELKTELMKMKKENGAQETELSTMKTRLAVNEREVENLKKENAAQASELSALKKEVEILRSESAGRPKVAFTAGLGPPAGQRGPFNIDYTLIYKNVLTNIGNAYNPSTGIFTAPVRGVYYLRFTAGVYDNNSYNIGLNLYKNDQHLMHLGENSSDGSAKHVSSGVTLELAAGDVVYTQLPVNYVVWDDSGLRTSFSGFLIFPM